MPAAVVHLHMPGGGLARVGTMTELTAPGYPESSVGFEYDRDYLASPDSYAISPDLPLRQGLFEPPLGSPIFAGFSDAQPDEWGRKLLQSEKNHRRRVAGLLPEKLTEFDALLSVPDLTRQGALRFSEREDGPFLGEMKAALPTTDNLRQLYGAVTKFEERGIVDDPVIRRLIEMGTSQGGARPKTAVVNEEGKLSIAKLPHPDDRHDVSRWEAVALALASRAGIETTSFSLHPINPWRAALTVERFDRGSGDERYGYVSAGTLLLQGGSSQGGSPGQTGIVDYEMLCDRMVELSGAPKVDGAELFRRIVFSLLIGNVDDHMGNHGFLRATKGWRLAPIFDINPAPSPRDFSATPISPEDDPHDRDIRLLMKGTDRYRLTPTRAAKIVAEVEQATASWRHVAHELGVESDTIGHMAEAFEHPNRERARAIAASSIRENRHRSKTTADSDQAEVEWIPPHQRNGTAVSGYYRQRRKSSE